ncbi:helix-turn-helix domain-containing protein [Ensifer adhaerens]|uniref:helix-turn-helix domain-containing protein n=1 Tax=Ensifer adhaerens TaxID=106592 RepID=UPI000CF06F71|nr:helix-turn-helix domain-containing protein [Ensifer adhaerens]
MREASPKAGEWGESPRSFLIERHVADAMRATHWHDHIEINLLLNGSMTYLFNGRHAHVEAGRTALFWAAIPHQSIFVTPEAHLICIYLPLADFLALPIDKTSRQAIMQGAFVVQQTRKDMMSLLAAQWSEEWVSGSNLRRQLVFDEVKLAVRRLILDQSDNQGSAKQSGPPANPAIRHAQVLTELINAHFAEVLTLTSLSKLANVHPTTANRAFRDVLGITAMEYLTRYRLARAMQRLAETDDPIVEIAHESGFGSNTRFYDVFKQRTGTTPRQFRLGTRSSD